MSERLDLDANKGVTTDASGNVVIWKNQAERRSGMKATIIRADEVKVGGRILSLSGIYEIKRIDVIHGCGTRLFYMTSGATLVKHDDDLITRIDPVPVEEREFWRVRYERFAIIEGKECWLNGAVIARDTKARALEALENRYPVDRENIRNPIIEHVRETILSREEIKP